MSADVFALTLMGQARFCDQMQATLGRWHPEHEWIVTLLFSKSAVAAARSAHDREAPAGFMILAGAGEMSNAEVKRLVCLSCNGEDYAAVEDQEAWLRGAAGKLLLELRMSGVGARP